MTCATLHDFLGVVQKLALKKCILSVELVMLSRHPCQRILEIALLFPFILPERGQEEAAMTLLILIVPCLSARHYLYQPEGSTSHKVALLRIVNAMWIGTGCRLLFVRTTNLDTLGRSLVQRLPFAC